MFEPKFTYTSAIVNSIATIERLYGSLTEQNLMPSLALKLSEENEVLATHHSTSIEGNPLTAHDVTNIVLGDQIPTTKSEKEVKNYFKVLNKTAVSAKRNLPISIDFTLELHEQLMKGLVTHGLGKFRNGEVFVGHKQSLRSDDLKQSLRSSSLDIQSHAILADLKLGTAGLKTLGDFVVKHSPPFHTAKEIEKQLIQLYDWTNGNEEVHAILRAGILHHQFAYIHPFFDGNGRLARLLTSYFLILKKYDVVKYFILDDYYDIDRQQYSDMLHSADKGNQTKWLEYFLEGIAYSLQAALARINKLKDNTIDEVTGEKRVLVTAREEEVIQIVLDKKAIKTSDIADELEVTRQQAHSLLASLVKKGILEKFGKTKLSYYKLHKQ